MKIFTFLSVICFFNICNVYGQDQRSVFIDSITKSSMTSNDKIMALVRESAKERYRTESKEYIDKAFSVASMENNPELKAQVYYTLGNYNFYNGKMDEAIDALGTAEDLIKERDPLC